MPLKKVTTSFVNPTTFQKSEYPELTICRWVLFPNMSKFPINIEEQD
jgi:hypothetical protein